MQNLFIPKTNKFEAIGWISVVITSMTILFICTMLLFSSAKPKEERVYISATIADLKSAIAGGSITAGDMGRLG